MPCSPAATRWNDAAVRVCLMIEGQEGVAWEEWQALARACEEHGLEGLFRSDHYLSLMDEGGRGSLDAWATLTALAAVTSRIRLGSMVTPATFRPPLELAKVVATADHVSGGRVELGLGAGWNEREHQAYGFAFPDLSTRLAMLAEQLELVHRQWTEEVVDFRGEHYRVDSVRALPKPLQRPRPPLIVGGSAQRGTVEPAVRFANEYDTVFAGPEECGRRRRRVVEACARAGRDPDTLTFSVMTGCVLGADRAELRERGRRLMARTGAEGDVDDFLAERAVRSVAGTLEEAQARLAEYEAAGVQRIFLQHLDHADVDMVGLIGQLQERGSGASG
jgi:F420-dependent oxidoreductase-like protein